MTQPAYADGNTLNVQEIITQDEKERVIIVSLKHATFFIFFV